MQVLVAPRARTGPARLLIAGGLALAVFVLCWYRHATFHSTTLDLAVYDQAVWKLAQFRSPELSTIGWNAFADHLSPVLFLFPPLYRLVASPLWLLAAQAAALGAGFLALHPALEAVGLPRSWRPAFAVAYVASPLLWSAAVYDFHPTTLAVPLLLVGLRAAVLDERRTLLLVTAGLLLLRDDLALAGAAVALVGWSSLDREGRRLRLWIAGAALAWMAGAGLLASALGSDRHWAFHYGYLADTPVQALLHPLRSATRLLAEMWRADNLTLVTMGLLVPLGLLPLYAPRRLALVAVPLLPFLASSQSQFHSVKFHYGVVLLPFALVAAAGAVAAGRPPSLLRRPVPTIAFTVTLLVAAGPWIQLGGRVADPDDYRRALALVGPAERVMATDEVGPHLAHRDDLLLFPFALAPAVPDFPLPEKARATSAETAAAVDVIVVGPVRYPGEQRVAYEAFQRSPYLADFRHVHRFGEVTVYRRTPLG